MSHCTADCTGKGQQCAVSFGQVLGTVGHGSRVESAVHLIGRDWLRTARSGAREGALRGLAVRALLGEEVDAGFEGHHGTPPAASGA